MWSEWEMSGTSEGGTPSVIAGLVIILSVVNEHIEHTRFYLDAVSRSVRPESISFVPELI